MVPSQLAGDGITWEPSTSVIVPEDGRVYQHFWPATARNVLPNRVTEADATRQNKNCYMVGLKEMSHFETGTDAPWEWRQIIFAAKGLGSLPSTDSYVAYNETFGYMRGMRQMAPGYKDIVNGVLFKGTEGVDWVGLMNAPVDRTRVTVLSDRLRQIRSGNGRPAFRQYKDWLPLKKTIMYDDDERGSAKQSSRWSVTSKIGLGDVFVVDFFRTVGTAVPADLLQWRSNMTFHWHER